ncbi:MAG: hypothetical protein HYV28_01540 [Ignavibacteriales bacterium]|nr:hypothetical protein [Ignavibacteriales bacterium]
MGSSINDYFGFLVFNMDMVPGILYTLEMCYGLLILSLIISFTGIIPYTMFTRLTAKISVHALMLSGLMIQWIIVQADHSGWLFIICMFFIVFVGVQKTLADAFKQNSSVYSEQLISLGLYNEDALFKSFAKSGAIAYLKENHLFFLGLILFSEVINDVNRGLGYFSLKVLRQYDMLLSAITLVSVLILIILLHLCLVLLSKRIKFPEGVFKR